MKTCSKCDQNKSLISFSKDSKSKDGLRYWCRDCTKQYRHERKNEFREYNKAYFAKYGKVHKKEKQAYDKEYNICNKEKKKSNDKAYQAKNKEKIREYQKKWDDAKKNKRNLKLKLRYKTDVCFKLATNLRRRIYNAVKNNWKAGSAVDDLGCSIEDFKMYIEQQFTTGMSWNNYGRWHLDHIIPLASFDLTDREQFLKSCHYTNLQPLWAKDNLKKKDRLDWNKNENY